MRPKIYDISIEKECLFFSVDHTFGVQGQLRAVPGGVAGRVPVGGGGGRGLPGVRHPVQR